MDISVISSNEQVQVELGKRIRRARIDMPLTQEELADKAGVSVGTVNGVERGRDLRLSSLLNILRALNMLQNVEALVPPALVRPTELARLGKERQRATAPAHRKRRKGDWVWGDEK